MKPSVLPYSLGAAIGGIAVIVLGLVFESRVNVALGFTLCLVGSTVLGSYLVGQANLKKAVMPTWLTAGLTLSFAGLVSLPGLMVVGYLIALVPNHAVAVIVSFIAAMMVACTIGASVKIPIPAENADPG